MDAGEKEYETLSRAGTSVSNLPMLDYRNIYYSVDVQYIQQIIEFFHKLRNTTQVRFNLDLTLS